MEWRSDSTFTQSEAPAHTARIELGLDFNVVVIILFFLLKLVLGMMHLSLKTRALYRTDSDCFAVKVHVDADVAAK